MPIDKIGQIEPIQPRRDGGRSGRVEKRNEGDSVNISAEARDHADYLRVLDVVKDSPDIRAERVAELNQKKNDPKYIDDILVGKVADKIMLGLGF